MAIGTNRLLFDEKGRMLVIRRDDIFIWALPGGSLETGELLTDGAIREVY
jgi:ADP-ribose pyrophosphatase YjhB (NUDIX family)